MTPASTRRVLVLAAGLLFGLGCEAVAPLQPLPDTDSGTDAATADKVGGEGGVEAGQLDAAPRLDVNGVSDAVPESDVGTTADVPPDTSDGGAPDDAPKTDVGDGDASDASSDDGGVVDVAEDSGDVGDASEDGKTTDGGGADGPDVVTCDPALPFRDAIPVYGLNRQPGREFRVHVSPDELTAYIAAGDAWWVSDLFVSQRSSKAEPFGPLAPLTTLNTAYMEASIAVTADGLTAVFDSDRMGGGGRIYLAMRTMPSDSFFATNEVVIHGNLFDEFDPYLLPDGSALYFTSNTSEGVGIYRVPLSGMNAGAPTPVVLGSGRRFPVVTPDERTIYFTSGPSADISTMTRASREMPFSGLTTLTELNTEDFELPQSLSPDGCRLYFTRTLASGASYSFVAERVRRQPDAGVDGP
jgi:hypothetical protein